MKFYIIQTFFFILSHHSLIKCIIFKTLLESGFKYSFQTFKKIIKYIYIHYKLRLPLLSQDQRDKFLL